MKKRTLCKGDIFLMLCNLAYVKSTALNRLIDVINRETCSFTVKRPLCRLHSKSKYQGDSMSKDCAYARNTKSGYSKESGQGQVYSCFISGKARFLI